MATIRKRGNSYQIRVYSGRDIAGRPIQTTRSWSPPAGMTKRETEAELAKIVAEMETAVEHAQTSQFTAQTPFQEFAAYWVRTSDLAPRTRKDYLDSVSYTHLLSMYLPGCGRCGIAGS